MKKFIVSLLLIAYTIFLLPACKKNDLPKISTNVPIAIAGDDQLILLPTDSVELNGSGKVIDGTILRVGWSKIKGPNYYKIVDPEKADTWIKNLIEGVYEFKYFVIDNRSAVASDIVQVTVKEVAKANEVIYTNLVWDWNLSQWKYIITTDISGAISKGLSIERLENVFIKNSGFNYWEEVPDRLYPFYKWQSTLFGFEKYFYYDLDKVHNKLVLTMTEFDGAALDPTLPVSLKLEFKN